MVMSNINSSQPIFVLGFHRGGTTFVQRLLNCHEKVTIWGENGGIISDLRVMSERYAKSPAVKVDVEQYRDFSGLADLLETKRKALALCEANNISIGSTERIRFRGFLSQKLVGWAVSYPIISDNHSV